MEPRPARPPSIGTRARADRRARRSGDLAPASVRAGFDPSNGGRGIPSRRTYRVHRRQAARRLGHDHAARPDRQLSPRSRRGAPRCVLRDRQTVIVKGDVIADRAGQRLQMLARPRSALTRLATPSAASSGLDERVVMLVIALAIAASAGLIAASQGLIATVAEQPARIATLLALTLALQM